MAYEYESKETRVLKTIDSNRYPDTNKDFEKNVRRLNSSVDYMAGYMRIMQKGIDDANKNFIEQIQSFINDIIVLFAGGEPTGIEIGDLKYIFQAVGALFGLNGPFPISLINAVLHFFEGFLAPLVQLTDLIFDAIAAWMEVLADALDGVPILGDIFDNLAGFFNKLGSDSTQALEDSSDNFQRILNGSAEISSLKSYVYGSAGGGLYGVDLFTEDYDPGLGPNYDVSNTIGLGGAHLYTSGGRCKFDKDGIFDKTCFAIRTDATFDTSNQMVNLVLAQKIPDFTAIWLMLRCDDDASDFGYIKLTNNKIIPGHFGDGISWNHTLGTSYSSAAGDNWEFFIGGTDDHNYLVKRNGSTVLSRNDSGENTSLTNYRIALGMTGYSYLIGQGQPPDIEAFTFYDWI